MAGNASPLCIVRSTQDVGQLIREERQRHKLRIDDAAALLGVSVDLMSRLENGKGSIRLDKLLAVLDGMGMNMVIGAKTGLLMRQIDQADNSRRKAKSAAGVETATKAGHGA